MTKQAERHRKLKDESRGVDKCGPKWPGRGPKRASDRPETLGHGSAATRFACGAGDGNRTRTVSMGRVLILPCFRVLRRYWRPQLVPGDPYRPGLVAPAWTASLASRSENRARDEVSWPRITAT